MNRLVDIKEKSVCDRNTHFLPSPVTAKKPDADTKQEPWKVHRTGLKQHKQCFRIKASGAYQLLTYL